jgi:hypothetical protein
VFGQKDTRRIGKKAASSSSLLLGCTTTPTTPTTPT